MTERPGQPMPNAFSRDQPKNLKQHPVGGKAEASKGRIKLKAENPRIRMSQFSGHSAIGAQEPAGIKSRSLLSL